MRKGANLLIVQNEISSPSGNANINVKINNIHESEKPFKSNEETSKKISIMFLPFNYAASASVFKPTTYFSARVVIVPSAYFAFKKASSFSLMSLPFLKPTAKISSP